MAEEAASTVLDDPVSLCVFAAADSVGAVAIKEIS